jgi:hypothetical protein
LARVDANDDGVSGFVQSATTRPGGMVTVLPRGVRDVAPSKVSGRIATVTPKMTQPVTTMIVMIIVAGATPGQVPW